MNASRVYEIMHVFAYRFIYLHTVLKVVFVLLKKYDTASKNDGYFFNCLLGIHFLGFYTTKV